LIVTAPRGRHSSTNWVRKAGGAPEGKPVRGGSAAGRPQSSLSLSGASLASAVTSEEATRIANKVQVSDVFQSLLYPSLSKVKTEDLMMIAAPTSVDWENVILYEGFTLLVGEEKMLFVQFPPTEGWLSDDFTPAVVALIELAEVILDCDRLFVCIERDAKELSSLVHSMMYVGFSVAESPLPNANSSFLMLEYETE
jgi:hypothetical protein